MAERKPWSQREDQILKDLRQVRLIAKWSQIAQIMKSQFQIFGRNGKQCRERYHNHLDSRICKQKWGAQEENKLLALHHQLGNRWAAISRELPGRTDNCVKNHFYSFFRKCIKNVNYSLNVLSERKIRPLKLSIMNKIVSIIEAHHKDPHNFDMTVYKDARDLKEKIFNFGEILTVTQENCREKLFQLSKKLADLNKTSRKNYARKRKAKIVYDESEQLHLKSKDQQFDQQEPPLDLGKITNEVKCEPEPIGPYKLCFPAWSTPSQRGETKKEEKSRNSAVKKEERMSENKNINSNLMIKAENITPEKQGREEKQKSSSYCKLYSVDYLDGNYAVPDVRDFIFIDDDKQWRFQLD